MQTSSYPGSFVDVSRPTYLLATFDFLENNLRSKSVSRQSTTDTISLDINVHIMHRSIESKPRDCIVFRRGSVPSNAA